VVRDAAEEGLPSPYPPKAPSGLRVAKAASVQEVERVRSTLAEVFAQPEPPELDERSDLPDGNYAAESETGRFLHMMGDGDVQYRDLFTREQRRHWNRLWKAGLTRDEGEGYYDSGSRYK
jgi:hypothetical protein